MTNMKIRYILVTLVIFCLRSTQCGEHPDGISQVSRAQDALGNYHFSYAVSNKDGDQFRKEGTDAEGRVVGSYGLTHNDGTHRVVDYVADQHGFRAEVRSNEPGVAPSDAAHAAVVRTDGQASHPLAVAETSADAGAFGKRLRIDGSKVAYAHAEDSSKAPDTLDDTVRESRQRNFDDYRPLSPVAYYPTDGRSPVLSRLTPTLQRPIDVPRSPRLLPQSPDTDSKPIDVYFPPIDPYSAVRRPVSHERRDADLDRNYYSTSTSRKPFIPPYGGFDDDPLPEAKHPGISMTTIHGGLGSRPHLPIPAPTPSYGTGRYPSDGIPNRRDFGFPRFPPLSSGFPSNGPDRAQFPQDRAQFPQDRAQFPQDRAQFPQDRAQFPQDRAQFPQDLPQTPLFSPPSYDRGSGSPNFVLRAVPIPNGIQAVRVDPTTGRIYERLVYPVYLRHDGHPTSYDQDILLHNDDVSDDRATRNDDGPGYFDIPFPVQAAYRGPRDRPFDEDDDQRSVVNGTSAVESNYLSRPTAADLAWVHRQLSMVEGMDVDRLSNGLSSYRDSEPPSGFSSKLRMRNTPELFDYRNDGGYSRSSRGNEGLSPEESTPSERLEESASDVKPVEQPQHKSEIEKEGN